MTFRNSKDNKISVSNQQSSLFCLDLCIRLRGRKKFSTGTDRKKKGGTKSTPRRFGKRLIDILVKEERKKGGPEITLWVLWRHSSLSIFLIGWESADSIKSYASTTPSNRGENPSKVWGQNVGRFCLGGHFPTIVSNLGIIFPHS